MDYFLRSCANSWIVKNMCEIIRQIFWLTQFLYQKYLLAKREKLCYKRKVLLKESKSHQQAYYYWMGEGPQHVTLLQFSVRYSWLSSLCLSVSSDFFKNKQTQRALRCPKLLFLKNIWEVSCNCPAEFVADGVETGEETGNMHLVVTSPSCVSQHQARQPVVVGQRSSGWEGL